MLTPIKSQIIIIIIPDQLFCYKSIIKNARVIASNIVMLLHTFSFKKNCKSYAATIYTELGIVASPKPLNLTIKSKSVQ